MGCRRSVVVEVTVGDFVFVTATVQVQGDYTFIKMSEKIDKLAEVLEKLKQRTEAQKELN